MAQEMAADNSATNAPAEDEVSVLDVLIVLAKHKKRIVLTTLTVAVLAAGGSLLMPNRYTAITQVLPPQQGQSGAAALLGSLGGLAGGAGGLAGIKNPNDLYVGMLKSRTLLDAMVARFDVMTVFDIKSPSDARAMLRNSTTVTTGKDGLIALQFDHTDPEFAAKVANGYIDELYKLTQELAVTEASQRRLFFEQQLKQARDKLSAAEMGLKELQEKTGLMMLSEQSKASIESVARVRGQVAAKEVQIQAMRAFATRDNPDLKFAETELASLRSQLARVQTSQPGDILVAPSKIPGEGLEYMRRVRDVKYSEVVFEVLAKQYELARIEEGKNASLIQVLDKAVVPDKKSKPKRSLIVTLATLAGFVASVLMAFISEAAARSLHNSKQTERWAQLRAMLRWRGDKTV